MEKSDPQTGLKQSGKGGDRHTHKVLYLQVTETNLKQLDRDGKFAVGEKYCIKFKATFWGQPGRL